MIPVLGQEEKHGDGKRLIRVERSVVRSNGLHLTIR